MKVRNHLLKKTEYKGRLTDARAEECPCMPCYNAHECGNLELPFMACATRYNSGCPTPLPKPEHTPNRLGICKKCKEALK